MLVGRVNRAGCSVQDDRQKVERGVPPFHATGKSWLCLTAAGGRNPCLPKLFDGIESPLGGEVGVLAENIGPQPPELLLSRLLQARRGVETRTQMAITDMAALLGLVPRIGAGATLRN
jgi:hypothetical protein